MVFQLRSVLAHQGGIGDEIVPSAISLPVSREEAGDMVGHRIQTRTARSVRLGVLTVR